MVSSLYLGYSLLSCGRVPGCVHYAYKKAWFGQKGLIIDGTLTHFNLCMDVTLSVYAGPCLLHSKRVFGFGFVYTRSVRLIGNGKLSLMIKLILCPGDI